MGTSIKVRKMILTSQLDKSGTAQIYIELLSYNKDLKKVIKRLPTGVRVSPKNWSKKKQEVLKFDPDYLTKNQIVADAFIKSLKPAELKPVKGLTDYLEEYILIRRSTGTPQGTLKEFTTCKNRLLAYEEHIGKKLHFSDMNLTFSDSFNIYLFNKGYESGTIEKTFAILRTMLNHFYSRRIELKIELTDTFRERNWKRGRKSINEPHPFTKEDFQKLKETVITSATLNKVRDRVLFQCSTGLRYSDAFRIKPSMVVNDCIKIEPVKTVNKKNNTIFINLNNLSKSILNKYDNDLTKLAISNQKYNMYILELCKYCKLSDVYTSHDCRDTFISNALNSGVPVPIVLSWTGQESYEVMKRYFKVDDLRKKQDMEKLSLFQ